MANNRDGGVKTFEASSREELEDQINIFLSGEGTIEDPRRQIVFPPTFLIDSSTFYAMLCYRTA